MRVTYHGKFWYHDSDNSQKVDHEVRQIIMSVMCAEQEQYDRDRKEEFFGWRVLVPIIDLLPHVEVVVGTRVKVKWDASYVVEHEVRAKHVADIRKRPGGLLRYTRYDVPKDLQSYDEDDVNGPSSCEDRQSASSSEIVRWRCLVRGSKIWILVALHPPGAKYLLRLPSQHSSLEKRTGRLCAR